MNEPSNLDVLVAEIQNQSNKSEVVGTYHQVPFRIYHWNFVKLESLKKQLGNPTRNKLLNQLLEIALDEVFKKLEKNSPEQLKEILDSIERP